MNNRVFGVCKNVKYAVGIFKGAKGVAVATKFRQIIWGNWSYFSSLQGINICFMSNRVFGFGKFKHAIPIFQAANGVAMATKCRQKLTRIAVN